MGNISPGALLLTADQLSGLYKVPVLDGPRAAQTSVASLSTYIGRAYVINVKMFGALGNDEADDYAAIQAAIDYVKNNQGYGTVLVPDGVYRLSAEPVINFDNGHLLVSPGATLKQMTYGLSGVQIRGDSDERRGCSVGGGGRIVSPWTGTDKAPIVGTYDGQPARGRAAGVYCIGVSDTSVYGLTFENLVLGVNFRMVNQLANRGSNNSLRNIICRSIDYGLLSQNQFNFVGENVKGYTTTNSQPTAPPHLIYFSFNSALDLLSQNVALSDFVDYDNAFSSSFKVRNVDGIAMAGFISRYAARGFDLGLTNFTLTDPQVYDIRDIGDSQQGCIELTGSSKGIITNPILTLPNDNDVLEALTARDDCADIMIKGGRITSQFTAAAAIAPVRVFGTRIKLMDNEFIDNGANKFPISIESTAIDCEVIRPQVKRVSGARVVTIEASATGTKLALDLQRFNFVFDTTSVSDLGTSTAFAFYGTNSLYTLAHLPNNAAYTNCSFIVTDGAGKNPAFFDGTNFWWPDGTLVFNPATLAYERAVVAAGGTMTGARRAIIDTFIAAETTSGAWALTDDYWPLWGENTTQALLSLKQLRTVTVASAPVFTADRGYAFNGTSDYLQTGFIPSSSAVAMTGALLRIAVYERTNVSGATYSAGVSDNSTRGLLLCPRNGSNHLQGGADSNNTAGAASITDSRGYSVLSRSSGPTFTFYKNGSSVETVVPGANATVLPTHEIYIGAYNNVGSATNFRASSIGLVAVGAPLTDAAMELAQYNAVQAWATSIGANV